MLYDPNIHHRRSLRLHEFDYSEARAYFVTLVTQGRENLFGKIVSGTMRHNIVGECAGAVWKRLPQYFAVNLDAWVIMPNHLHGILVLQETYRTPDQKAGKGSMKGTQPGSLNAIIQNLKSVSTRRINVLRNSPGMPVWQRDYYEHIIRDEEDWARIADYIELNPVLWETDEENRPQM